jgi:hypothetical protein
VPDEPLVPLEALLFEAPATPAVPVDPVEPLVPDVPDELLD